MLDRIDAILGPIDRQDGQSHGTIAGKELLELADEAAQLGDIRNARFAAATARDESERREDAGHAVREKEYQDLHDQVQSSHTLLTSLEAFISTFQNDLSAVSGHISDLQGRSKVIEARLQARKSVRNSLSPLLSNIIISPSLIDTFMDSEPSEAWLKPVAELERILLAIRSGPRIAVRKDLDDVAEKLRLRVAGALRTYLINLLTPYRTSITPNLSILQTSILTKYRSFFAFLQRHAARAAHEVQKAYVSTAQWYYDTGFRRYVRALERIRARSVTKDDPIGVVGSGTEQALSVLTRKNVVPVGLDTPRSSVDVSRQGSSEGTRDQQANVILANMADQADYRASPELLFRSISVVLADNARAEYSFVSAFFGQPEDVTPNSGDSLGRQWNVHLGNELSLLVPTASSSAVSSAQDDDTASVISEGISFATSAGGTSGERGDRLKKHVVDHVWKQVFEPTLEYAKNFVAALLTQSTPSLLSVLTMIRENDAIFTALVGEDRSGKCPTLPMESHLMGMRIQLWPLFQKEMGVQTDSVKKLTDGSGSGGMVGFMGGSRNTAVKDSVVASVARRYVGLFVNIVAQSDGDQEDDMIFQSLLRLRAEIQRLITTQAGRLSDPGKASAYLKNQYEQIHSAFTSTNTSHPRSQTEIAWWRELLRKA